MSGKWPRVRLGLVAPVVRRPVEVDPYAAYREIGIRSFGRGVFHKPPLRGIELGEKRVFRIEPGDLVFNNVFAWEGAVAVAGHGEAGMIGSHRFITCPPDRGKVDAQFLYWWFCTSAGRDQLALASPGGAGRNRTLGVEKLSQIEVPLPPLAEQRQVVLKLAQVTNLVEQVQTIARGAEAEAAALVGARAIALFAKMESHLPIEAFAEVRGGIQKGPHRVPGANPVRYLTVAHVQRDQLVTDDPRYFEVSPEELARWRLVPGDVLIIEGNGSPDQIGRAALFRGEIETCVHQNHVIRLRPDRTRMLPEFLNMFLNSPAGQEAVQAESRSTSGLRTLSVGRISQIRVPVPEMDQQERVARSLERLRSEQAKLMSRRREVMEQLSRLVPAVLDRTFDG